MRIGTDRLLVACVVVALAHPVAAASPVTPIVGDVRSTASGSVFDGNSFQSFFTLDPVTVNQFSNSSFNTSANNAALLHGQVVGASNSISADWTRPDLGAATFNFSAVSDPLGFNFQTSVQSSSAISYQFQTGSNRVVLRGTWALGGSTPSAVENLTIVGFGLFPNLSLAPGSFEINYSANRLHNVAFQSRIRQSASEAFALNASAVGQLTWSISGVPEPANWAMLIAGFGLTGAVLRRRRAAFTAG